MKSNSLIRIVAIFLCLAFVLSSLSAPAEDLAGSDAVGPTDTAAVPAALSETDQKLCDMLALNRLVDEDPVREARRLERLEDTYIHNGCEASGYTFQERRATGEDPYATERETDSLPEDAEDEVTTATERLRNQGLRALGFGLRAWIRSNREASGN